MNCENIKIYIPEYIDGKLDSTKSETIKTHLEKCDECKKIYNKLHSFLNFTDSLPEIETPDGMKEEFLELAELDKNNQKQKIFLPFWIKVAAVIVIAFSTFATGYFTGFKGSENKYLQTELVQLKQEVFLANFHDLTGPQKIQTLYNVKTLDLPENNLITALVSTMNNDNNVNVRLAAINALSEMIDKNENVKTELINSLSVQENPLLQISLIQVLTESGITEAKDKIESISNDENTDQNVKIYAKDMIKTII